MLPGSIAGGIREKKRPAGTLALRMRAIQRCGGFTKRAIRQKNGADASYTLYTEHALCRLSPEPQEAAE